jgi:hypothetical protein
MRKCIKCGKTLWKRVSSTGYCAECRKKTKRIKAPKKDEMLEYIK